MDEQRGSTSSINFDILSVGTADARPIAKGHASLVDNAGTRPVTPHNEMQQHTLPSPYSNEQGTSPGLQLPSPGLLRQHDTIHSPNFSRPSPLRSRPLSTGTIEDLRRPQPKRRSIIDPATVRLSFAGSVSEIGSALPLEEGLQKLYNLYNEHTNPTVPLPHTLSITDVPLSMIADALSNHIRSQSTALLDCAHNLHNLTNLHEKMKQDLITLEQHYSLAVEKSNIAAMSTEDVRRRLGWQIEEIIRINTEKEIAINEAAYHKIESQRLSAELQGVAEIMVENEKLREESSVQRKENKRLREASTSHTNEVEELKGEIEEVKNELRAVRKKLESVPKQIVKVYAKLADGGGRRLQRRDTNRGGIRTGLLIPASPKVSENSDR